MQKAMDQCLCIALTNQAYVGLLHSHQRGERGDDVFLEVCEGLARLGKHPRIYPCDNHLPDITTQNTHRSLIHSRPNRPLWRKGSNFSLKCIKFP